MYRAATDQPPEKLVGERLDSWKDIAAYLQREVRTVQLWEKNEGLPVHRHAHQKRGTVYAYKSEIDAWAQTRSGVPQPQTQPPKGRRLVIAAVIAILLTAVGEITWLAVGKQSRGRTSEANVVPLTSDPGSEMGASFSPDGSQVAFAWKREGRRDFDIYVRAVGSHQTRQLTNTPDWDVAPAWSPDGRQIVFHRAGQGREGECGIYSVSPLGGPAQHITELSGVARKTPGCWQRCGCWEYNPKLADAQFSWSPDGKWLAHAGISLIAPATGQQRVLTNPTGMQVDAFPAFSPDGKSLAFVRTRTTNNHELYVVPADGGELQHIPTQGHLIFGLCWTPDSREIVYSSGTWELGDAGLWRVPVDGRPARRVEEARERAWLPAMSPHGRLAFTRRNNDSNVWQLRLDDPQPAPTRLIASTRVDGAPAFSPDGSRIAFTSDRSGTLQIWVCDRDGSNERQLTFLPAPGVGRSAWSPDSKQLAFDSRADGTTHVYVIDAGGGTPSRIGTDPENEAHPTWSRDGKWVYFSSTRTGRHEIWKMPAQGGRAVQLTKDSGNRPVESPDGNYVYYDKGPGSGREFHAWRVPIEGGEEASILEYGGSRWSVVHGGFYLYQRDENAEGSASWFLKFFDSSTRQARVIIQLSGPPIISQPPAVSPDGRTLLYTQIDINDTDLMLVDNFR
jgi:Tol biopolymer transport system component